MHSHEWAYSHTISFEYLGKAVKKKSNSQKINDYESIFWEMVIKEAKRKKQCT
jgi:hypothetical protein